MPGSVYDNLNPEFADDLKRLLSAAQTAGKKLSVTDAFRSLAQQEDVYRRKPNLAFNPHPHVGVTRYGPHMRGIAADFAGDLDWAHQNGPKYGIRFPLLSGSKVEPWHGELARRIMGRAEPSVSGGAAVPTMEKSVADNDLLRALLAVGSPSGNVSLPSNMFDFSRFTRLGGPSSGTGYSASEPRLQAGGPLAGPLSVSDEEIQRLLDVNAAKSAVNEPLETNILKAQALKSPEVQALLSKMRDLPVPSEAPINEADPRLQAPVRPNIPIPEAQAPKANRFGRILAAIGGLIAPEGAGQFMASELGGEQEGAQRSYQDALTKYKMATDQANTQYEDQQAQRNFMLDLMKANQDRAYRSAVERYKAQYGNLADELEQRKAEAALPGLQDVEKKFREGDISRAEADAHREAIKRHEDEANRQDKLQAQQMKDQLQAQIAELRAQVQVRGQDVTDNAKIREDIARKDRELESIKSKEKIASDRDNAAMARVRAIIAGRADVANKVDKRVRELSAKSSKNDPLAQVLLERIKAAKQDFTTTASAMDKSVDALTSHPEANSERLEGKRKAVDTAIGELESYIRKRQGGASTGGKNRMTLQEFLKAK